MSLIPDIEYGLVHYCFIKIKQKSRKLKICIVNNKFYNTNPFLKKYHSLKEKIYKEELDFNYKYKFAKDSAIMLAIDEDNVVAGITISFSDGNNLLPNESKNFSYKDIAKLCNTNISNCLYNEFSSFVIQKEYRGGYLLNNIIEYITNYSQSKRARYSFSISIPSANRAYKIGLTKLNITSKIVKSYPYPPSQYYNYVKILPLFIKY